MPFVANTYNTNKLAVTIKGAQSSTRQAVNLIFLIDVSGSMEDRVNHSTLPTRNSNSGELEFLQEGTRLESVKKSIEFLIPLLTQNDMVTLITFGDESAILAKAIQMSDEGKSQIITLVRKLTTNGCTNMSAALLNVADLYKDDPDFWASPGHKHGILLLTDGHANRGVFTPDAIMSIIAKLLTDNQNLSLTTVGYGQDHNAELLKQAATTGSGSYNVVNTLEDIATTFGEVIGGLTTVVAQNVCLTLPVGVELLTSYITTTDSSGVHVRVGDVYAEQEIIVLANNYNDGELIVKGYDMTDISSFRSSITPVSINEPTKSIVIAELRYKVSQLLKNPDGFQAELLLTQLRSLPYVSENIIQMMIDDCETVLEVLESGRTREAEVEMAQHSAYLGLGRGLRSMPMRSPSPPSPPRPTNYMFGSAPGDPVAPISRRRTAQVDSSSSPFSNQTQIATTSLMRERSRPTN